MMLVEFRIYKVFESIAVLGNLSQMPIMYEKL